MTKYCSVLLISLSLSFYSSTAAVAGLEPGSGITGSVHDLNTLAFVLGDDFQRVCVFCHTPHNAAPGAGMLWSRQLNTAISGLAPYTWTAPANQDIPQDLDPLVGPSRLCMTCHDGVIAIDPHGGTMPKEDVISKELNFTHPIGFRYDDAMRVRGVKELVDKEQHFATAIQISDVPGQRNVITRNARYRIKDVLYEGAIMTCSTCHDVHNKNNVIPDQGHNYNFLLWAKEEQSLICLSCHIK
jgi:hypothetical protein